MRCSFFLALSALALILPSLPALSQPGGPIWETLDLSPEQQQQLNQLRQDRQNQVMEILTEDQQQQLEVLKQTSAAGSGLGRGMIRQLDLSVDQQTALRQLHDVTKVEVQQILTPAQQDQLQSERETRRRARWGSSPDQPQL